MMPNINLLLQIEIAWAIATKKACPVDQEDAFPMRVRVIGPRGEMADTPLRWHSPEEKYVHMRALSKACGLISAHAAIIVTDTRYLDMEAFCAHYGLVAPANKADWERFDRECQRIMAPLGHQMSNLPRQLYHEALAALAYGPLVSLAKFVSYRVVDGQFVFDPVATFGDKDSDAFKAFMLPAWWQ